MSSLWSLRLVSNFVVAANSLVRRSDGTINRKLSDFLEMKVPANPKPVKGVSTFDVVIDAATGVWARVFVPTQEVEVTPLKAEPGKPGLEFDKTMPVMFYFHGGGFAVLSPDFGLYDAFCRRLARRCQALVISVHYRRSPEHKFPTAYDDCYRALEWLGSEEAAGVLPPNTDRARVFLSGDSAGGNIAHHVAVRAAGAPPGAHLRGLLLIQPFFGGEERTPAELRLKNVPIVSVESLDWHWLAYLPAGADRDHPACNIFGPHARDLADVPMPPTLVIIGGLDILQDWEMRYVEGMKKAGKAVEVLFYAEGIHTFGLFNQAKVGDQMMLDIIAFVHDH